MKARQKHSASQPKSGSKRSKMVFALSLVVGATILATCATPTPYQPVTKKTGYSDQMIEDGRYQVSFAGNSLTKRDTVENYLLYRAAELTLQSGHDYFIVVERNVDEKTYYRSALDGYSHGGLYYGIDYGYGGYGYPYYGGYGYPYYGGYGDYGYGYSRPVTKYTATAEITAYKGNKPSDNPKAYDARDVIKNLSGVIQRPDQVG